MPELYVSQCKEKLLNFPEKKDKKEVWGLSFDTSVIKACLD